MSLASHGHTGATFAGTMNREENHARIHSRLEATRRLVIRRRAFAIAWTFAASQLGLLGVIALVDFHRELTWDARATALVVSIVSLVIGASELWRRWGVHFQLPEAARLAEAADPGVGQGLRTALDYGGNLTGTVQAGTVQAGTVQTGTVQAGPAPALAELIAAQAREAARAAERVDWSGVVSRRSLLVSGAALILVVAAWLVSLAVVPEWRTAAARVIWLAGEYTTIDISPLDVTIKSGESVTIDAQVRGRPVPDAKLRFRPLSQDSNATDTWQFLPLLPSDMAPSERPELLQGKLTATLAELRESVEFQVVAGPRDLPLGTVRVLQPLTLKSLSAEVTPPAYTGLPAETQTGTELRVREGSRIVIQIELNRSPLEIEWLASEGKSAPRMAPNPSPEPTTFEASLEDVREPQVLELRARAEDGIELEPVQIPLRVLLDEKPRIQFVEPEESLEVLPTTEVRIRATAQDDLGLFKVGIVAQMGNQPAEVVMETDASGSRDAQEILTTLLLENYPLTFQDGVTYHAFAEDLHFGVPRRVTTPLRFIDIRPYQREYEQVDGGGEGSCSGSTTLEELIVRQRMNLSRTFVTTGADRNAETRDRLATHEAELRDATAELSMGLAARGVWVPELDGAAEAMGQASEAFARDDWDAATTHQQSALERLLKARQNIRQKLKQSSSESRSECRKFDQQQRQKLRTPEQKKQDQQQQVAQVRSELEQLARQQREWSEEVRATCNNPQSSSAASASARETLAQQQSQMQDRLSELREQLEQAGASSMASRETADRAGESMQAGLNELREERGESAAKEGEQSAAELQQLSEHLHALQSSDFSGKLESARRLAEQVARDQGELASRLSPMAPAAAAESQGESATSNATQVAAESQTDKATWTRQQRVLAQRADMLAERLAALRDAAAGEKSEIGQRIGAMSSQESASEIGADMRRAADDAESGRMGPAAQGAARARDGARRLAGALGGLRQELAQPELQELLKLEEQIAALQRQLERANQQGESRASGERWSAIASQLERLARGDRRVAEALWRMSGGGEQRVAGDEQLPQGFQSWSELPEFARLSEVARVVQAKIQEAVLAGAAQDADAPVPPEYRGLVEEYYRALSDDLSP